MVNLPTTSLKNIVHYEDAHWCVSRRLEYLV